MNYTYQVHFTLNDLPETEDFEATNAGSAFAACLKAHPEAKLVKAIVEGRAFADGHGWTSYQPPPVQRPPVQSPRPARALRKKEHDVNFRFTTKSKKNLSTKCAMTQRSQLKRKKGLKRSALKPMSDKRQSLEVAYRCSIAEWTQERIRKDGYLRCQMVGDGRAPNLAKNDRCLAQAMASPHHRKLRGRYLINRHWFQALCFEHHRYVHDNPNWARKRGYLLV